MKPHNNGHIATTLGQLAEAEAALGRLAGEKLPFQTAYRIAKLAKAVAEETKHFVTERNALVQTYGAVAPGSEPGDIRVTPDLATWPQFVEKVQELAAVEVTIPLLPIDLVSVPDLTIAAADLLALGPLVQLDAAPASPPAAPPQ